VRDGVTFEEFERQVWEDRIRIGVDKLQAARVALSARPPVGSLLPGAFRAYCRIVLGLSLPCLVWGLFEISQGQYTYGVLGLVFWGLLTTMLERLAVRRLRSLAATEEAVLLAGLATGLFRLARERRDGGLEPVRYP
jgi:hypothetical protein